jgi:hypothetical protein
MRQTPGVVRWVAEMSDGRTLSGESRTVGEVMDAVGGRAAHYEGDGDCSRRERLEVLAGLDYGRLLIWASRADMEGRDGMGDTGASALCEVRLGVSR